MNELVHSTPEPPGAPHESAHQSLEEVLEAGTESLRLSIDLVSGSDLDFETLDEAVSRTGSKLGAQRDEKAIQTLELARGPAAETVGLDKTTLEAFVARAESVSTPVSFDTRVEAPALENTSILLHQAHGNASPEQRARRLEVCTRGLDPRGVAALILDATKDQCERLIHAEFDQWMMPLVPLLRRTVSNLSDGLAAFAAEASPHGRAALWPFVVDEHLTTLKGRSTPLDPRAHELDPIALEAAIERLCALPAIRRPRVTPGMFALEQSFVHPLLLRLMQSPARRAIGPVILGAFRESLPVDTGISFCVFAMRQYEESLGWLLGAQLENVTRPVHPDIQRSAAWLLVSVMDSMHPERRSELWVPGALQWLGERDQSGDNEAQRYGTQSLLQRVVQERNGLRRAWSRDCRHAAKAALRRGGISW